jgi:hypothetical protein
MEEIIKTTQLESEKSTLLIDLIRHRNGIIYISIDQILHVENGDNISQKIKINPIVLNEFIKTLVKYQKEVSGKSKTEEETIIIDENHSEIIKRYFKGVDIKDLALQFDCSEAIIEQILTNNSIPIVSNNVYKYYNGNSKE